MKEEIYDFDAILQDLGSFGKFQRQNFLLLSVVIAFSAMSFSFVFTTRSSNYRCYIDECDPPDANNAVYNAPWLHTTTPFKNNRPVMCQRFDVALLSSYNSIPACNRSAFSTEVTRKCDRFVFENGEATIERDFNLTCAENMWKLTSVGSIGDFAEILGLPLIGYLSDRFGRRSVMIIGCVASGFFGAAKSYLNSYEQFMTFEVLETMIGSGIFNGAYILAVELVTPSHRVFCSTLLICMFSLGNAYLCLVAWWTQSWRMLLRIIYFPAFAFLLYYYHLNESVRWLLVRGRIVEAKRVLEDVAQTNGTSLKHDVIEKCHSGVNDDAGDESMWKAFASSRLLRMRFACCAFVWLTCVFVFYGFNMKALTISGNLYVNYFISVLTEIPANMLCYLLLNGKQRKPVLSGALFMTSVMCFLLLVVQMDAYEIVVVSLGKGCITIALSTLYVYAVEVFPTSVRHSVLACCSIFGRIGGMAAPQIPLMATISPSFAYALFMSMSLTSAILTLTFPESCNTKLPDTVSQAAAIGNAKCNKEIG